MNFNEFKMSRVNAEITTHQLDALIATLPENIYYLSGYYSMGQNLSSGIYAFYLTTRDQQNNSLIMPHSEILAAQEKLDSKQTIYCYGNFYFSHPLNQKNFSSAQEALIHAITKIKISSGSIGLDESKISPQIWEAISFAFPNLHFIPAAKIFQNIRKIKHNEEIQLIGKAASIAEDALYAAVAQLKLGISEIDITQYFMQAVIQRGAEPCFNVATIGKRSALVDVAASNNKLLAGSILRLDVGCSYQHYKSDFSRTVIFGNPSHKLLKYYTAILNGQESAIQKIRPGQPVANIFNAAIAETRKGLPHFNRQHCGHGIGLEIHESPSITETSEEVLEKSMVLCVETPYYEPNWAGIQIEDTLLVTETGSQRLTQSNKELIKISC